MNRTERPVAERPAREHIQHRQRLVDMIAFDEASRDMLRSARGASVNRVDIQIEFICDIGRHDGSGEPLDSAEMLAYPRKVKKIRECRRAIVTRRWIEHGDRRPARTEVNLAAARFKILRWIAAVDRKRFRGAGQALFHDHAGKISRPEADSKQPALIQA